MATGDKDILGQYMEVIDHLEVAYALTKTLDGQVGTGIHNALEQAKASAAQVSFRVQRKEWKNA